MKKIETAAIFHISSRSQGRRKRDERTKKIVLANGVLSEAEGRRERSSFIHHLSEQSGHLLSFILRKKCIPLLIGVVITGAAIFAYAGYEPVSLGELINSPAKYDREIVSFQAEVIGEPLFTESGTWFNVTSGSYHIGVFLEDERFLDKIEYWGSYAEDGDILRVKGIFYKNCPLHYQLGVHLIDLEISQRGQKRKHLVSPKKEIFAWLSLIICLTMALIYLIKRQWKKKSKI